MACRGLLLGLDDEALGSGEIGTRPRCQSGPYASAVRQTTPAVRQPTRPTCVLSCRCAPARVAQIILVCLSHLIRRAYSVHRGRLHFGSSRPPTASLRLRLGGFHARMSCQSAWLMLNPVREFYTR